MNRTILRRTVATLLGGLAVGTAVAQPTAQAPPPPGPDSSVLVLPVVLERNTNRDFADVVALMLEQAGMPNTMTTDAAFRPPAGADSATCATALARWIPTRTFTQDWVILAEIDGAPHKGVDAIRLTLADRTGRTRWTERQTRTDQALRDANPKNPMACCMFMAERLAPRFHLTSAHRGRVADGPMARRWAEKSGSPTEAERAAIEERCTVLKKSLATATIQVYPAQANVEAGRQSAVDLAGQINAALPARVVPAASDLELQVPPNANQQRRLWDLARAFRRHLRANPPEADYALVAEYTFAPNQQVWTVHTVICDGKGEWVLVDFQNNHHDDFNAVAPKTAPDCGRLVVRRLKGTLAE